MDNHKQITDFDLKLIAEFFKEMPRQGPGGTRQTLQALDLVGELPPDARIVDMGCGTGKQTADLAEHTPGHITAVDFLPEMIAGLDARMRSLGLSDKVTGLVGSMGDPLFEPRSLDLIWAEGSIYNVGFETGLRKWHEFLKPGGFVAVTETSLLLDKKPDDRGYIDTYFPEIDSIAGKVETMQRAGYQPTAHFILPPECWTENYYAPLAARVDTFSRQYGHYPAARELVESMKKEQPHYLQYGQYYGYVFYIGRKIG